MKKNYYVFAGSFFLALGNNMVGFSLIYRLTDLFSFNPGQIGFFMALGSCAYFLGCNLYNRFVSVFEPINVFPATVVIIFAASIPIGFVRITGVVYVAYWVLMIGAGMYWPPVMAWLTAGVSGKDMNKIMSHFNRSWMSAIMVGPAIAGALYKVNSTAIFFLVILCYCIVLTLFFLLRLSVKKEKNAADINSAGSSAITGHAAGVSAAGTDPAAAERPYAPVSRTLNVKLDLYRYKGWIGGFSSSVFGGILLNIVPLYIRDGLGYTEQTAGLLLFVRCFSSLIGFSLLARFTAWHFNRKWFFVVQAGIITCVLFFLLAGSNLIFYFFIVFLYGLLNSASYNNSMLYSSITGKNPKKNLAFHEIFMSVGTASGSAGGGFFYQHFGFTGTCCILLFILCLGMAAFIFLERRESIKA